MIALRRGKATTRVKRLTRPIDGATPIAGASSQRGPAAAPILRGPQRERHEPDWVLLLAVVALAAVGILMVYSSTGTSSLLQQTPFASVGPQALWGVLGAALLLVIMRLDYRYLRLISVPAFVISVGLLVLVMFLPTTGLIHRVDFGESSRWLQIGPLPAMHPAEFAKLALVIYLAHWLAKRGARTGSLTQGLLPFLLILGVVVGLVYLEPDLGTTGVLALTGLTMFFVAGGRLRHFAVLVPAGIAAVAVAVMGSTYQMQRVTTLLNPWADRLGDGHQTVQGLLALGMGGVTGIGLGQSRQPGAISLPQSQNDFVFALLGQELGFIGAIALIGLYLLLAYRGLRIALSAPDTFGALLATGITAWLVIQAFINIGVVVVLIPVTGITLPFVSQGGSSLLVSFAAVGILLSISRETLSRGTWNDAILIAAGGTGGHVYPALAVARSLRERAPDVEFRWLGGHRGLESSIVPAEGFELDLLPLRSLRTVDLNRHTVLDPARLGASYPTALGKLLRWRPDAVFTTGGYIAIPVVTAAASLRVPSVMWEGNLIAGRSVRATARFANVLALSFAETAKSLPGRCYVTGTPIRSFAGHDRATARTKLGLEAETPVVFIFGGSQQVRRMNRAVWTALQDIVGSVSVIHMTGEPAYAEALKVRETLATGSRGRYKPYPFLRAEMTDALVASDMLVGRAGSSTLAEASALGLPMVVVPYPHASAHQMANARALADAGAARIVADEDFDAAALRSAVEMLHDDAHIATMRAASRSCGRPGAAAAVAELVLALAEGTNLPAAAAIDKMSRASA